MIINTKEFKEVCRTILAAIDTSDSIVLNETLQLKTEDNKLKLSVTNREYFVTTWFNLEGEENLNATVKASSLLKLIAQFTSDTIELNCDNSTLHVIGNGDYKLPLIYNNDKMLELPEIPLGEITSSFNIESKILNNIYNYNSKELQSSKNVAKPVQKMYYVDNEGAITFTTGACVNSFSLDSPIKILLSPKVVKLFRLFKDENVKFSLGHSVDNDGNISTRVKFEGTNIEITAIILSDVKLIESVPVKIIRERANKEYNYSITLNRSNMVQALTRLSLFDNNNICNILFGENSCTIKVGENEEEIVYENSIFIESKYSLNLNLTNLKNILEGCQEEYVTLNFGDNEAVVLVRQSIRNVIPEIKLN